MPPRTAPITLEMPLGELKDRSAARRRKILTDAAPQMVALSKRLSKSARLGLEDVRPDVAEEALRFYNAVVADGRFVRLLRTNPESAAEKLGERVRPEALDVISRINGRMGGNVQGPVEAVIAVAVVVAVVAKVPERGVVIDHMANVRTKRL
jgi:hypothetical protein